MDSRIAGMSILVDDKESVEKLNEILHEFGKWIIGRMGIPYLKRQVSCIGIFIDAPQDVISSLSGKIGRLNGVSVKVAYSNYIYHDEE